MGESGIPLSNQAMYSFFVMKQKKTYHPTFDGDSTFNKNQEQYKADGFL